MPYHEQLSLDFTPETQPDLVDQFINYADDMRKGMGARYLNKAQQFEVKDIYNRSEPEPTTWLEDRWNYADPTEDTPEQPDTRSFAELTDALQESRSKFVIEPRIINPRAKYSKVFKQVSGRQNDVNDDHDGNMLIYLLAEKIAKSGLDDDRIQNRLIKMDQKLHFTPIEISRFIDRIYDAKERIEQAREEVAIAQEIADAEEGEYEGELTGTVVSIEPEITPVVEEEPVVVERDITEPVPAEPEIVEPEEPAKVGDTTPIITTEGTTKAVDEPGASLDTTAEESTEADEGTEPEAPSIITDELQISNRLDELFNDPEAIYDLANAEINGVVAYLTDYIAEGISLKELWAEAEAGELYDKVQAKFAELASVLEEHESLDSAVVRKLLNKKAQTYVNNIARQLLEEKRISSKDQDEIPAGTFEHDEDKIPEGMFDDTDLVADPADETEVLGDGSEEATHEDEFLRNINGILVDLEEFKEKKKNTEGAEQITVAAFLISRLKRGWLKFQMAEKYQSMPDTEESHKVIVNDFVNTPTAHALAYLISQAVRYERHSASSDDLLDLVLAYNR